MIAAFRNDPETIRLLIDCNADATLLDEVSFGLLRFLIFMIITRLMRDLRAAIQ
jgi:hypothetical protein